MKFFQPACCIGMIFKQVVKWTSNRECCANLLRWQRQTKNKQKGSLKCLPVMEIYKSATYPSTMIPARSNQTLARSQPSRSFSLPGTISSWTKYELSLWSISLLRPADDNTSDENEVFFIWGNFSVASMKDFGRSTDLLWKTTVE